MSSFMGEEKIILAYFHRSLPPLSQMGVLFGGLTGSDDYLVCDGMVLSHVDVITLCVFYFVIPRYYHN